MSQTLVEQHTTHAVVESLLGDLTVVRRDGAVTGIYFSEHSHMPDPATFGERDDAGMEDVADQIGEYLRGERRTFTFPVALGGDALQRKVWDVLAETPYGSTTTYGAMAARIGGVTPRQVGSVLARNPLCLVVPCHRVLAKDGNLTGYAGGLDRKEELLALERHYAQVYFWAN